MIVGPSVVLDGRQCSLIAGALVDAEARARRDGRRVDDEARRATAEVVALANAWRASRASRGVAPAAPGTAPSGASGVSSFPPDGPLSPGLPAVAALEAAELAGVSRRRIAQLGASGAVARRRVGGRWAYDREGVEEYARQRGAGPPAGRPAGARAGSGS